MTNIHTNLHAMVLRSRWIRWLLRQLESGRLRLDRAAELSKRLTRWRPMVEEREFS